MRNTNARTGRVAQSLAVVIGLCAVALTIQWPEDAVAQDGGFTAVPSTFPVQGYLTDGDGPVDGERNFTLELYTRPAGSEDGGDLLYQEDHDNHPVNDGVFNLDLGAGNSSTSGEFTSITPQLFRDHPQVFLEISVNGQPLTPRRRLQTAPFAAVAEHAVSAQTAESATNAEKIGSVDASQVYTETRPPSIGDLANQGYNAGDGIATDVTSNSATIRLASCPAGQVYRSTGSGWACAPSLNAGQSCPGDGVAIGLNMNGTLNCQKVQQADIADDAVGENQIASSAVGAQEIDNAEVQARLDSNCGSSEYLTGIDANGSPNCDSFSATYFTPTANGLVLADDAVGANQIDTSAVGTDEVDNNSLTSSDLASGAADTDELATDAVTHSKVAQDAIEDDNIDYGCGSTYLALSSCAGFDALTANNANFPTCNQVGVGDVCAEQSGGSTCISNANIPNQGDADPCQQTTGTISVQLYMKVAP